MDSLWTNILKYITATTCSIDSRQGLKKENSKWHADLFSIPYCGKGNSHLQGGFIFSHIDTNKFPFSTWAHSNLADQRYFRGEKYRIFTPYIHISFNWCHNVFLVDTRVATHCYLVWLGRHFAQLAFKSCWSRERIQSLTRPTETFNFYLSHI